MLRMVPSNHFIGSLKHNHCFSTKCSAAASPAASLWTTPTYPSWRNQPLRPGRVFLLSLNSKFRSIHAFQRNTLESKFCTSWQRYIACFVSQRGRGNGVWQGQFGQHGRGKREGPDSGGEGGGESVRAISRPLPQLLSVGSQIHRGGCAQCRHCCLVVD